MRLGSRRGRGHERSVGRPAAPAGGDGGLGSARRGAGGSAGAAGGRDEDRRTDVTIEIDEQLKRYQDLVERSLALRGYL